MSEEGRESLEVGIRLIPHSGGLVQTSLDFPGVELDEQVALLDLLAGDDGHLLDPPAHLGFDNRLPTGLDRADGFLEGFMTGVADLLNAHRGGGSVRHGRSRRGMFRAGGQAGGEESQRSDEAG